MIVETQQTQPNLRRRPGKRIYEMKNYPVVLISTVISPLSLLAVVTFVSNGNLFGTAIEGGLIMTFFSSGIALQSDLSHLKNDFKLQDMVVSSPTSSRFTWAAWRWQKSSIQFQV